MELVQKTSSLATCYRHRGPTTCQNEKAAPSYGPAAVGGKRQAPLPGLRVGQQTTSGPGGKAV